ncbi:MAG TPA: radical SAM protein [Chitinophagales bacterium]|nr:radical SAM protein [Chitinophagales bacterium]
MQTALTDKLRKINARIYPQHVFAAPEWLVLGVNNTCNLHCKMCDVGTRNNETVFAQNLVGTHPINMPIELFKKIVDQSALYYPNVKLGYAFTEPLVYPHLIESLEYAKQKKLKTYITTNALKLPQLAEEIARAGLTDIFVSLDGTQETHNYIRGHKSSFQRAIEGIEKLLVQPNRPGISVFCTITEWNTGELKKFTDYFSKYPLAQLGFMHTNFTSNTTAAEHNALWGNLYAATHSNIEESNTNNIDLSVLHNQILQIKSTKYPFSVSFSPELRTAEQLHTFYMEPEKQIGSICNDAFRNIMIKSDGSVIPAHGRCYNITVGNLYQQSLKEIWNSQQLSKFRKDLMKSGGLFPACARCCSAF